VVGCGSSFLSSSGGEADFILVGGTFCRGSGCGERLALPTRQNEPPPDQRLPPRERRTKRRRTTARTPELHRQSNAMEIERSHPTLEPLPTNTDQNLPTPSGPTDLKKLSHTFLLRELLQGGRAAWQRWTRRITRDARQPEGVVSSDFVFSGAKWQGAFQWLQQACQPRG